MTCQPAFFVSINTLLVLSPQLNFSEPSKCRPADLLTCQHAYKPHTYKLSLALSFSIYGCLTALSLFLCLSICLLAYLSPFLTASLCFSVSLCLLVSLYTSLSLYVSLCLFLLSVALSLSVSLYLSLCVFITISISVS